MEARDAIAGSNPFSSLAAKLLSLTFDSLDKLSNIFHMGNIHARRKHSTDFVPTYYGL